MAKNKKPSKPRAPPLPFLKKATRTWKDEVDFISWWQGEHRVKMSVSDRHFHHHGDHVAKQYPDVLETLERAISKVDVLACQVRGERGKNRHGADPTHWNFSLRERIKAENAGWRFEAIIGDGVILDHVEHTKVQISGFDIARYDVDHNVRALWNMCFGRRAVFNGENDWANAKKEYPHWKLQMDALEAKARAKKTGVDLPAQAKKVSSVLGEIQTGNWGLVHRDHMKLLQAQQELAQTSDELDLFVYIVPARTLSYLVSSGTVSFLKTKKYLHVFKNVIKVPAVVLGVDVEIDPNGADRFGPLDEALTKKMGRRVKSGQLYKRVAEQLDPDQGAGDATEAQQPLEVA